MQAPESYAPVAKGPVAYRYRLRRIGPILALVPPAAALCVAALVWHLYPCAGTECVRSGATGWGLAALALPTALLFGLPWQGSDARYLLVAGSSALLWVLLGFWAAKRATRRAVASWRDFWAEYAWMLVGVWGGVLAALGVLGWLVRNRTFF
jgi:hypothetical protein